MPEGSIPKNVERYVQEGKDQGLSEEEAWAVAWSRYCEYKEPNSPHCQQNRYFPNRAASARFVAFLHCRGGIQRVAGALTIHGQDFTLTSKPGIFEAPSPESSDTQWTKVVSLGPSDGMKLWGLLSEDPNLLTDTPWDHLEEWLTEHGIQSELAYS